jgi:hypothetical protein
MVNITGNGSAGLPDHSDGGRRGQIRFGDDDFSPLPAAACKAAGFRKRRTATLLAAIVLGGCSLQQPIIQRLCTADLT